MVQGVKILAYILEMSGSNTSRDIKYSEVFFFCDFPQSIRTITGIIH
jgi:hypothetical protein